MALNINARAEPVLTHVTLKELLGDLSERADLGSSDQADFERTVELGYVVDRLANYCGPNLAVLYELACALDEFHGTDEQEPERPQRTQPHRH
jgi:hypothetical protein